MVLIRRTLISLLTFCVALLFADLALIALGASIWLLYGAGLLLTVPTVAYAVSAANGRSGRASKRNGNGRLPGPIH